MSADCEYFLIPVRRRGNLRVKELFRLNSCFFNWSFIFSCCEIYL